MNNFAHNFQLCDFSVPLSLLNSETSKRKDPRLGPFIRLHWKSCSEHENISYVHVSFDTGRTL